MSPTLCLNMIVKNESKIITRLFDSVIDHIDTYCICDTGSTDNTIEIIEKYFQEKNKPGKIVQEPFRDFGYNRTFALKACQGLSDYVLLLDADMIFKTTVSLKQILTLADTHYIYQGSPAFYYKNLRIVRNNLNIEYWGVTHEYVNVPKNTTCHTIDKSIAFINDVGDGGCKVDKFERDIRLLQKGLMENPNNDRYTFYLANSYHDARQWQNAINTYKDRIKLGGWREEVWYSYYRIGLCYKELGQIPLAISTWLDGYNFYENRIENLYEIVKQYRIEGKHKLAYVFYQLAKTTQPNLAEALFLRKDIYDYLLDYEMTITCYYYNPTNIDLAKLSMAILAHPNSNHNTNKSILSNYKFYSKPLNAMSSPILIPSIAIDGFNSSTPSIVLSNDKTTLYINVRYVNYKINEKGVYENQATIISKNRLLTVDVNDWTVKSTVDLPYDTQHDCLYVGSEDVRLLASEPNKLLYSANRGLKDGRIVVERGTVQIEPCTNKSILLQKPGENCFEKNWTMIDPQNMIYKWHPLTIGQIENDNFVQTHEITTPRFFQHVRGSTNGIQIGDEIWFIAHTVSYETRRYYYHLFIVIDKTTYSIKRYTRLFTFARKPVEYTLGFVYFEQVNQFMIGYSVLDRTTEYMMLDKTKIEDLMIGA